MTMAQAYSKSTVFRQPQAKESFPATIEHIIGLICQVRDKVKVLRAILPYAMTISQAEVGALLAVDDDAKSMAVVARQGMADEMIEQLTKGALGQLLLSGQWVRVEPKSLQLNPEQALLGRHDLKCLLGIPFQFEKQVVGAIVVGTRTLSESIYQEKQQKQLATLARLVALFLDNVRLRTNIQPKIEETPSQQATVHSPSNEEAVDDLEELLEAVMSAEAEVVNQNNDLGLLNTLSDEMGSTLQFDRILEIAVKHTRQALKAEAGWCYLCEDDLLVLYEHQGLSKKYVSGMQCLASHEGVEGMAFSRNERIVRDGVLFHSGKARKLVQEEGLCTIAAVPLAVGEKPIGVLAVANQHDRVWSARDKRMLTSISKQVSQAISNAQTFSEAAEKAQGWEANYSQLQEANSKLAKRAATLESQIQELRRAEQQVWTILAASSQARQTSGLDSDEQLMNSLRKALGKLSSHNGEIPAHIT